MTALKTTSWTTARLRILELKKIKESFTLTTLNMLHSRLQYPEARGHGHRPTQRPG